jgi:hypothetical protein
MTGLNLSSDVLKLNPELSQRERKLARLDDDGYKSELERRCAREWMPLQEPAGWIYEPFSVKLGQKVNYTPDFLVWFPKSQRRMPFIIECKGWTKTMRADKMRFDLAAEKLPCFMWLWLTWDQHTGWVEKWAI